jgi:hypothetical protein
MPVIRRAIGVCTYSPAFTVLDGQREFDEGLDAEIVVDDWMMSDLWHAMRTPGLTFRSLNMSLFGNRLLEIGAIEETIYDWENDATLLGNHVYIAGFQYITEMLPEGRAEVTSVS